MSAFDSSLAEYLTQSLGEEDENDISREKNMYIGNRSKESTRRTL